jgi:hypothetical protein
MTPGILIVPAMKSTNHEAHADLPAFMAGVTGESQIGVSLVVCGME